jgi:3-oxoacyl-[acyl-carrier protein] reductase
MGRVSFINCLKRWVKGMQPINIEVNNVHLAPSELLKGRNAIITGAGSGIGLAIAKTFITSGATVVGVGRSKEKLEAAKKEINSERFIPFAYNVADVNNLSETITQIESLLRDGNIDILVNCAGVRNGNDSKFFDFSPKDFEYVVDTNLKGVFFWSQEAAKHMISKKIKGHILNVVSIKGFIGEASPYSVSKWGCVGLTKGLGRLLAPYGIVVNGIAPGGTKTPMAQEHAKQWLHLATPSMRLADPNEMANLALFMASDLGNNMNGEVVISDGGQSLQYGNDKF